MNEEMNNQKKMRSTTTNDQQEGGEDILSKLPDDLIHHILRFLDVQLAVQTSVLSKRWKLLWTTLPFLNFTIYATTDFKYIYKLLDKRNHDSKLLKFRISPIRSFSDRVMNHAIIYAISYAISHHVQELNVDFSRYPYYDFILSRLSSSTIKKLELSLYYDEEALVWKCWKLPALTSLKLVRPFCDGFAKLPESYFTCLPYLKTLSLDGFELPKSICLPTLTTLNLYGVEFTDNVSEFFRALVNLRNLTLLFRRGVCAHFVVDCPQLVNFEIQNYTCPMEQSNDPCKNHKVIVLAPNIRNFTSVNFCPVTFGVTKLERVNIRFEDFDEETVAEEKGTRKYCLLITDMFWGLRGAKILTLDLKTIEALSYLLNILVNSPSPFFKLEYVKVPHGYNVSRMSTNLKNYLLGSSPKAAIVTTLPQKTMIPHTEAVSLTAHTMVLQKPLEAPTKVLDGFENMQKASCVNTLDMGVQEEDLVKNSVVNADRGTEIGVPVQGIGNDQVRSPRGDGDVVFWQGYPVNSEFVSLLDRIMNKYPETFEIFTTTNKKLSTMKLNMLANSVSVFTKISMTQVDTDMIAEHRIVFDALHKLGFNISWLVNRLNYIEQLQVSQPILSELHAIDCRIEHAKDKLQKLQIQIDDTKTELQDLHTLRTEKMQQIQKTLGTTSLVVGYIGDDILSDP